MLILVKLIGVVIAAFGLAIFISPAFTQKVFSFFKEGKRIYYAGVIRVVLGVIILTAASRSQVPLAAIALGLLFLMSGIIVFMCEEEKIKALLSHYSEMPPLVVRFLGIVPATFGVLVFSIF
ncbi:MAG TPA: hypothetical protein PKL97_00020 [Candidatus Omnitrophota bacterium]|nr:hypothetical protein [Candidatus Omnitrophota bacterium]